MQRGFAEFEARRPFRFCHVEQEPRRRTARRPSLTEELTTSRDGRARKRERRGACDELWWASAQARAPKSLRRAVIGERARRCRTRTSAARRPSLTEELATSCGGRARKRGRREELATRSERIALSALREFPARSLRLLNHLRSVFHALSGSVLSLCVLCGAPSSFSFSLQHSECSRPAAKFGMQQVCSKLTLMQAAAVLVLV